MKVCTVNKSSRKAKEGLPETLRFQLLSDHFLEATCIYESPKNSMHYIRGHATSEDNLPAFFHHVDPEDQTHVRATFANPCSVFVKDVLELLVLRHPPPEC